MGIHIESQRRFRIIAGFEEEDEWKVREVRNGCSGSGESSRTHARREQKGSPPQAPTQNGYHYHGI